MQTNETTTPTNRQQFHNDILITAVEGGINYWAAVSEYKWCDEEGRDLPVASVMVHEYDDEAGEYGPGRLVTATDIGRAVRRITNPADEIKYCGPGLRGLVLEATLECDSGLLDAGDADCVLQIALLGEVVYG